VKGSFTNRALEIHASGVALKAKGIRKSPLQEEEAMKVFSKVGAAVVVSVALASPAFAGTPGIARTYSAQPQDPATIAELQQAADKALQEGHDGNKNNLAYRRKNYEIEHLVAKMQSGEPVQHAQIEDALRPVQVW
jgi:hypothetical protein